jgi:hypothetical protein
MGVRGAYGHALWADGDRSRSARRMVVYMVTVSRTFTAVKAVKFMAVR